MPVKEMCVDTLSKSSIGWRLNTEIDDSFLLPLGVLAGVLADFWRKLQKVETCSD